MATQQVSRVCYHLKPRGPSALNIARVPSELKNTGASTHFKEMPTSLPLELLPFRLILDFAMCSRDTSRRNYPSRPAESPQIPQAMLPTDRNPTMHTGPKYQLLLTHNSSGCQGLTEATESHALPAH